MIGTVGRVSGRVGRGLTGEVILPVRGGTEAFIAYASDPDDDFDVGTQVVVVDAGPNRTVYVAAALI